MTTSRILAIPTRRAHSNHAEVARSIGVDIIAGRYAEGTRLPGDAEMIAMFGVSRPVLRESVKTLVAKGLLTTKARVGTVVRERVAWNMFDADVLAWHLDAGIDKRFLNDLAEIRLAVEPRAAMLAAAQRSEQDLSELRRCMERMRLEASDSVGFADADLALHVAVARASGNLFMRSIGHVIELRCAPHSCSAHRSNRRTATPFCCGIRRSSMPSPPVMLRLRRRRWSTSFTMACAAMRVQ